MAKNTNPNQHRNTILMVTLPMLGVLLGSGTIIFHYLEGWTWIQSFYFSVATISTVGYGDLKPSNDTTRLVVAIYILIGVALGAGIISSYGKSIVHRRVNKQLDKNITDD